MLEAPHTHTGDADADSFEAKYLRHGGSLVSDQVNMAWMGTQPLKPKPLTTKITKPRSPHELAVRLK